MVTKGSGGTPRVLVVDAEAMLADLLAQALRHEGWETDTAQDGLDALAKAASFHPDVVILDVQMPRMDGLGTLERLRAGDPELPVLFLTARDAVADRVQGLRAGADDYVTKPFIADELLLRIDAHVRRHRGDIEHARKNSTDVSELVRREPCRIGDLEVFFDRYEVHLHGEAVPLTAKEFEILALLAESPGEVFTRRRIYEHLWGEVAEVDENSITVFMRKIREKIEDNPSGPRYLLTVWRVGYKLAAE